MRGGEKSCTHQTESIPALQVGNISENMFSSIIVSNLFRQ